MSKSLRHKCHTVTWLTVHIVWVTKYRYRVLEGDIQHRSRDLVRQICESEDVKILRGVISKDHVHIHLEYPPSKSISNLVKSLKGRSSRRLQEEFPQLWRRYWGRHFLGNRIWSLAYWKYNKSDGGRVSGTPLEAERFDGR